jgi:ketosteroid isomerase-like protein
MPALDPEELHPLFAKAFSAGDLDSLMALYELSARLVPQPEQAPVAGDLMREALRGYLALKPKITLETVSVIKSGEIALLRSNWRLSGFGPDGNRIEMSHRGVEVARRQADGTWLLVIDHPFGAD